VDNPGGGQDQGASLLKSSRRNGSCTIPPPGLEHDDRWPTTHGFFHKAWNGREAGFLLAEIREHGIEAAYSVAKDLERDRDLWQKPADQRKRIIIDQLDREHVDRGHDARASPADV
jgi:hypothetical protein